MDFGSGIGRSKSSEPDNTQCCRVFLLPNSPTREVVVNTPDPVWGVHRSLVSATLRKISSEFDANER